MDRLMEYKVSAVKQSELPQICGQFTDKLYDVLYDTATYKKDEGGWSFFIKKNYLEGLLEEIKKDKSKYLSDDEVTFLEKVLELFGENYLLLIDNDGLLK